MYQKSLVSRAMANPPRRTTVAQMKPKAPIPLASFSRMARRSAKSVSFFSGASTVAFDEGNVLVRYWVSGCGSKSVGVQLSVI